jgi:hypothetical protein
MSSSRGTKMTQSPSSSHSTAAPRSWKTWVSIVVAVSAVLWPSLQAVSQIRTIECGGDDVVIPYGYPCGPDCVAVPGPERIPWLLRENSACSGSWCLPIGDIARVLFSPLGADGKPFLVGLDGSDGQKWDKLCGPGRRKWRGRIRPWEVSERAYKLCAGEIRKMECLDRDIGV